MKISLMKERCEPFSFQGGFTATDLAGWWSAEVVHLGGSVRRFPTAGGSHCARLGAESQRKLEESYDQV